jgi:hypothetical protein
MTTITIADKAINTTYQDRTGTTSGTGTGAKFDVVKTNGVYSVGLDTAGTGYAVGDTITLLGTGLGGTVANNLIITVATVGAGGAVATFGAVGTGRVGDGIMDIIVDVDGTDGVDTYTFTGNRDDYTVTFDSDATDIAVVSDLATNVSFNLADHERVVFNDIAIAFDTTGAAGTIFALLGAGLGVADIESEFMGAGIFLKDAGLSTVEIAQALLNTDVYKTDAGGVSNETFIKHVYQNVYGSAATLNQVAALVDYMEVNQLSQAQILVAAANLEVFQDTIDLVGMQTTGIEYTPYVG